MEILTNEERKALKRQLILDGARRVFRQKGFIDVTMKDIIEECQISRGGIYLYFDSVDSIFIEVLKQRTSSKFDGIRQQVLQDFVNIVGYKIGFNDVFLAIKYQFNALFLGV